MAKRSLTIFNCSAGSMVSRAAEVKMVIWFSIDGPSFIMQLLRNPRHCVPVFEKIVKDRISAVDRRSSSLRANSSQYVLSQDLKLDMASFRKSRARKIDSKGKICRLDGGSRPSSVQPECDMRGFGPLLAKLKDHPIRVGLGGGLAGKDLPSMGSHDGEFPQITVAFAFVHKINQRKTLSNGQAVSRIVVEFVGIFGLFKLSILLSK